MRYCIVRDVHFSAVWTCQTTEDFEFHHNVVANTEYLWMRRPEDRQTYRISDCVVIDTKHFSGYGVASGPTGQTGPEVRFVETNVITDGNLAFTQTPPQRVRGDSVGSDLGAGLFEDR